MIAWLRRGNSASLYRFQRLALLFLLTGLFYFSTVAANAGDLPKRVGPVNDFANVLDHGTRAQIKLVALQLKKRAGVDTAVVTVTSAGDKSPHDYAHELSSAWKLGDGGGDHRTLLILLALHEKRVEVEVGSGISRKIPPSFVNDTLDQDVLPIIKEGQIGQALLSGLETISERVGDRPKAAALDWSGGATKAAEVRSKKPSHLITVLLLFLGLGAIGSVTWKKMKGMGRSSGGLRPLASPIPLVGGPLEAEGRAPAEVFS